MPSPSMIQNERASNFEFPARYSVETAAKKLLTPIQFIGFWSAIALPLGYLPFLYGDHSRPPPKCSVPSSCSISSRCSSATVTRATEPRLMRKRPRVPGAKLSRPVLTRSELTHPEPVLAFDPVTAFPESTHRIVEIPHTRTFQPSSIRDRVPRSAVRTPNPSKLSCLSLNCCCWNYV